MKFFVAFSLAFLALGVNCGQLEGLEGQLILGATRMVEDFLAPLTTIQRDVEEIYLQGKSNFKAKGFSMVSTDDCLALTNTTQTAYKLAANATQLAKATVKEVAASLNEAINCPQTSWLPDRVIKCTFDRLKEVRQELLDAEANFAPYQTQAAQLYAKMILEVHACVGF